MEWSGPVLDNHLHLGGDRGRGLEAVADFSRAGGTHLLVVNKPSWWHDVSVDRAEDFAVAFKSTAEIVESATDVLPGRAWAVLGVHPALVSRLIDDRGFAPAQAEALMCAGIDEAGKWVDAGEAIALKTGRPHYPVASPVMEVSNTVMRHTFAVAAELDCAVQLHTEGGTDFTDIAQWAREAGLDPGRVVKHYADGPIDGVVPSVIAKKEALDAACNEPCFFMETDYLDDPDRPGAVLGPKTVPRRVAWLAEQGRDRALEIAHVTAPKTVYGIDTQSTWSA